MKKIILVLLALSFIATSPVYAGHHEGKTPEQKEEYIEKKMKMLTKKLDLTDAQVVQVGSVLRNKMDRKYAVKERKRLEMKNIREEFKTNMYAVLGEEQREEFDEMMEKYEKKRMKKKKKFLFF